MGGDARENSEGTSAAARDHCQQCLENRKDLQQSTNHYLDRTKTKPLRTVAAPTEIHCKPRMCLILRHSREIQRKFCATSLCESLSSGGDGLSAGRDRSETWRHTRLSANAPGLPHDGDLNQTTHPFTSGLQCGPKPRKKSPSVSLECQNKLQYVWKTASEQHAAVTSTCTE